MAHDGKLEDGLAQFGDVFLDRIELAEVLLDKLPGRTACLLGRPIRCVKQLSDRGGVDSHPFLLPLLSQSLQLIATGHELVDTGNDAVLLGEGG